MARVYNFCAGPAVLPLEVLQEAQSTLVDYQGSGMSLMECSHRGKEYMAVQEEAIANLRALLQAQIDAVAAGNVEYDAVLLGYGLCGNSTLGLEARRFPLVIPRAHDCTTLFLGSKEAFQEHFGPNPSQTWASVGWSRRARAARSTASGRFLCPATAHTRCPRSRATATFRWPTTKSAGTSSFASSPSRPAP